MLSYLLARFVPTLLDWVEQGTVAKSGRSAAKTQDDGEQAQPRPLAAAAGHTDQVVVGRGG